MEVELINVKKIITFFSLAAIGGCHNPVLLSENDLHSASSYLDILKSNVSNLEYNEKYDRYAKWQNYDMLVGLSELKKPKIYAGQFCSSQGGVLNALEQYSAPIPSSGFNMASYDAVTKHLEDKFGIFACTVNGIDQWRVEIAYGEPKTVRSIRGEYGVTIFVTYTDASNYSHRDKLKKQEESDVRKREQMRFQRESQMLAERQKLLTAEKIQTQQNKTLGATVCLHASSLSTDVLMAGTVEKIHGDKVKVFFDRAYYLRSPDIQYSGFKQQYMWGAYWEFLPCSYH